MLCVIIIPLLNENFQQYHSNLYGELIVLQQFLLLFFSVLSWYCLESKAELCRVFFNHMNMETSLNSYANIHPN